MRKQLRRLTWGTVLRFKLSVTAQWALLGVYSVDNLQDSNHGVIADTEL